MPRFFSVVVRFVFALVLLPACSSDEKKPQASLDASAVTFNEISAAGDDWLELYNAGEAEFDLGGYAIADTDKTSGQARLSKAMRFPAGTKLARGGFSLVLLGKSNSTPGPYAADACLPGVSAGCFYALFSVSQSRGEPLHLLAPDNTSVSTVVYPANLEFEAGTGLTACRLPDGTGGLTTCVATPAAANQAM